MIPVALSTGSVYTYGTARVFDLASRAGYDGLEVIVDERWDTRQPKYLRQLSDQYGIPVLSIHSPFVHVGAWPSDELERVKRALELAEAVGARTLNIHVPRRAGDLVIGGFGKTRLLPVLPPPKDHLRFARWLLDGGLAGLQAQTSVSIAVENLPYRRLWGRHFTPYALNTWEELSLFPRLCLDTTHTGTSGADLLDVLERLGNRVTHVHLSDWNGKHQHQPVERGHLPLAPFLQRLGERQFAGTVVVELTPQALPAQSEEKLLKELRRNLTFCRRYLGQEPPANTVTPPVSAITHPPKVTTTV
jgi:sugar phosphate isomerase/epimerase